MSAFLLAQVIALAAQGGSTAVTTQQGSTLDGRAVPQPFEQPTGAAFARDGRLAVFGGKPGISGGLAFAGWKVADFADLVTAAAFGPDWVAAASQDRTIRLYTLEGGLRRTLSGHAGAVLAVAVSPDGKTLVSGGADSTIRVWDPASGALRRALINHGDRVNALAWSPDGRHLASASRDRTLRFWQPDIGRLLRIVKHDAELVDVAWPGEVVTACADGRIRIFEAEGDAPLKEFDAGSRISALAITPKGILAAAGDLKLFTR